MAEVGSDMDSDVEGANHEEENQTIVSILMMLQFPKIATLLQASEPLLADIIEK